jgi:hypothetical protein
MLYSIHSIINRSTMKILNIKTLKSIDDMHIAYCGNNYKYWAKHYPIILKCTDFSVLGKPRELIVRGNRPLTCNNYEEYLRNLLRSKLKTKYEYYLYELQQYDAVACWCSPLECHTSRIIKVMNELPDNTVLDLDI